MRIDVKLTARLLNADKCREGEVAETDVVFPTTKAAIQEAYRDNVVYVIRDFSLARVARENVADLISAESKDPVVALIRQFQTPDFEVKDTDGNLLAGSYGRPMIGRNNNIEMKLSLRLILHVANQLERVDLQKN